MPEREQRPYTETYTYNKIGNIMSRNGIAYTYGVKPHAVTSVGTTPYDYDANGNMITRGWQTLAWDIENRLTSVTGNGTTAQFFYDGNGNRIKKIENGETILYINKYYEVNITTGNATSYYYLGGRLVAQSVNATLSYVHQDHLTSTSLMTDATGAQIGTTVKYLPFGEARAAIDIPTDKLFTGQRLDSTGLYYYNARYYDPTIGRFISADTIIQSLYCPQCFNRYSYCLNNPLKYIDPSGNNDVTVTTQPFTPEQIQAARLLGIDLSGYDLYYVTDASGTSTPVAADNSNQGPTSIPTAVYDVANKMREAAGDNELNIIWKSDDLIMIDHYVYDESNHKTLSEQYYINPSRNQLELINSSNLGDPFSLENMARYTVGGILMVGGAFLTYWGCGVFYAAFVPPFAGSRWIGGISAFVGAEIFFFGYNLANNESNYWFNPFEALVTF